VEAELREPHGWLPIARLGVPPGDGQHYRFRRAVSSDVATVSSLLHRGASPPSVASLPTMRMQQSTLALTCKL
jgi:hypothetical protein